MNRLVGRAIVIALVLAVLPTIAPTRAEATTRTMVQHVAIPSYIYPTSSDWDRLKVSNNGVSFVIANVANGPGDGGALNDLWRDQVITQVAPTGTRVLGYVDTGYVGATGKTTIAGDQTPGAWLVQAEQQVERWYAFYGSSMGGIFFDQGMNTCGTTASPNLYADTYQALNDFVKSRHPGALVVLNPGNGVPSCYEDTADILVTFEGPYEKLLNPGTDYQTYAWQHDVDPNKFWDIVYNVTQAQIATAMATTRANNAGYVYLTSETGSNPYSKLPSVDHLAAQIADAANVTAQTPQAVTNLTTPSVYETGMDLSWTSNDWWKVAGYDILLDGTWYASASNATPDASEATVDGLLPGTTHTVSVVARTWSGQLGTPATVTRTLTAAGTPRPAPVVTVGTVLPNSAILSWPAATGVASYDLYTNGVLQARVAGTTTSARLQLLVPGSTYTFTVVARSTTAALSPASAPVTVTTPIPVPMVSPGGTLSASVLQVHVRYQVAFATHHAFIDDGSQGTNGYTVVDPQNTAVVLLNASYMFEEGILYLHDATKPGAWAWIPVVDPQVSLTVAADGTYTWSSPRARFGTATSFKVVFHGSGGGSTETALPFVTVS